MSTRDSRETVDKIYERFGQLRTDLQRQDAKLDAILVAIQMMKSRPLYELPSDFDKLEIT